jgi:glutaredoxin 2
VYVYDHCPFCVRVRLALGVKNVKHLIHFLANDDVMTPTRLVGKKIAPIFVSLSSSFFFLRATSPPPEVGRGVRFFSPFFLPNP